MAKYLHVLYALLGLGVGLLLGVAIDSQPLPHMSDAVSSTPSPISTVTETTEKPPASDLQRLSPRSVRADTPKPDPLVSVSDSNETLAALTAESNTIHCSGWPYVVSSDGREHMLNGNELSLGKVYLEDEFPEGYIVCYPYHITINGKATYIISVPAMGKMLIFTGPGASQIQEDGTFFLAPNSLNADL